MTEGNRSEHLVYNEARNLTSNDKVLELVPTIKKAAKSIAYNWPGVLDEDDAFQSISLKLLESPGSVTKILGMDRAAQYRAIVGIGHQLASKERANYDIFKGSYRYSVKEVKDVLSAGVLVEDFDHFHEVVFDLMEGLEVLTDRTPQYVDAILSRYADFEIPKQGADAGRLSRALEVLTNEMNKSNKRRYATRDDGPGTRKVISNEKARLISSHQYSGDHGMSAENYRPDGQQ